MNCNDGKCGKIRKEGIVHEENICLKSNKKDMCIKSNKKDMCIKLIKNIARAVLNFIEYKYSYIFIITMAITIFLLDIEIYYFTDFNLHGYHSCIVDAIRGNVTTNESQFTTCIINYGERSESLILLIIIINVMSVFSILHNIILKRELNSIDAKLNKNMNMYHENIFL